MAQWSASASENLDQIVARNEAVKEARGLGIDTSGFRDLRRALRALDKEIDKELRAALVKAVRPVVTTGRALAPVESGALRRSIRPSVTQRGVAVGSRLPYANLIHWGGSTGPGHRPGSPWSGSILVRESLFLSRALEQHEDRIVDSTENAVMDAARRLGWT